MGSDRLKQQTGSLALLTSPVVAVIEMR